ncbi:DNA alkylation repair protein [Parasphaerochaeta coccoides]|uniref:DNA alkylation repair enzyme n=1 Tax=Parasphaerochaeta coccoides (strain ATCC BAA-1237 / DSM 17374 / SPN1) TaxID=760011 RepID=F4GL51_PARC1|nr:DNA alkylation repair protein [Parasphaerochaeta coccoides]AEC02391.1 hypothetical protein Spico_1178 [Parasphaerochaeta coccoides DSM 17374]
MEMKVEMNPVMTYRALLKEQADSTYKTFSEKLKSTEREILGVRMPFQRTLASRLASSGEGREYSEAAGRGQDLFHEEVILRGMVIAKIKVPLEERLELAATQVPLLRGWASCDSLCSALKFSERELPLAWEWNRQYLSSPSSMPRRFGLVMLLTHFIRDAYINDILTTYRTESHPDYLVRMGAAWGMSVCCVYFPDRTSTVLKDSLLFVQEEIRRLAIRKCKESYRIPDELKKELATTLAKK